MDVVRDVCAIWIFATRSNNIGEIAIGSSVEKSSIVWLNPEEKDTRHPASIVHSWGRRKGPAAAAYGIAEAVQGSSRQFKNIVAVVIASS